MYRNKAEMKTQEDYCITENFEGNKFRDFHEQSLIAKILCMEISCSWHFDMVVEKERKS